MFVYNRLVVFPTAFCTKSNIGINAPDVPYSRKIKKDT